MERNNRTTYAVRLSAVILFSVAMAFVEATVVVYLRELFYYDGFTLSLENISARILTIEIVRELATLLMLGAVAFITGQSGWDRFGWFVIAFGVWDIFYYVWLKITLDWPGSVFDPDILFLIPSPWIGPVIAPAAIAILMVTVGVVITRRFSRGKDFHATAVAWIAALIGTGIILYSFMSDAATTLSNSRSVPYPYHLLILGMLLYVGGFVHALRRT